MNSSRLAPISLTWSTVTSSYQGGEKRFDRLSGPLLPGVWQIRGWVHASAESAELIRGLVYNGISPLTDPPVDV